MPVLPYYLYSNSITKFQNLAWQWRGNINDLKRKWVFLALWKREIEIKGVVNLITLDWYTYNLQVIYTHILSLPRPPHYIITTLIPIHYIGHPRLLQKVSLRFINSNKFVLVKKSSICSTEENKRRRKWCLTKWALISMCLVRSWKTGLLVIQITLLLSHKRVDDWVNIPKSAKRRRRWTKTRDTLPKEWQNHASCSSSISKSRRGRCPPSIS